MATISFELTGLKLKALTKIANQHSMTPEDYAESIVVSFLNDQVRGHYQGKFNGLTTLEMINLFGDLT